MTQTPDESTSHDESTPSDRPQIDAEPAPEPDTDGKRGVNDPDPEGTGSDEPLTSL